MDWGVTHLTKCWGDNSFKVWPCWWGVTLHWDQHSKGGFHVLIWTKMYLVVDLGIAGYTGSCGKCPAWTTHTLKRSIHQMRVWRFSYFTRRLMCSLMHIFYFHRFLSSPTLRSVTWSLTGVITPLSLQSTESGRSAKESPNLRSTLDNWHFHSCIQEDHLHLCNFSLSVSQQ